jgi:hypothetical protein
LLIVPAKADLVIELISRLTDFNELIKAFYHFYLNPSPQNCSEFVAKELPKHEQIAALPHKSKHTWLF